MYRYKYIKTRTYAQKKTKKQANYTNPNKSRSAKAIYLALIQPTLPVINIRTLWQLV